MIASRVRNDKKYTFGLQHIKLIKQINISWNKKKKIGEEAQISSAIVKELKESKRPWRWGNGILKDNILDRVVQGFCKTFQVS